MKRIWPFYFLLITSWAQAAPFQNLGFDEANTNTTQFTYRFDPFLPPLKGIGPAQDLVPGWQLLQSGNPVLTAGYDLVIKESGGNGYFSLISQLEGNKYGVAVEGPYLLSIFSNAQGLSLSQRGDVPPQAQFLEYKILPAHEMDFLVNGELLPSDFDTSVFPAVASVDISPFAGQNVEFSFRPVLGSSGYIDSIAFVVPEPLAWMLLGIGGLEFFATWLCRRMRGFDPSRISRIFEG